MTYPISTVGSNKDNMPGRGVVTWEQLVDALSPRHLRATPCTLATCERSDCRHKVGLAWLPAVWPAGHKRKVYGIETVSLLVVDLDHVKPADLPALLGRVAQYRQVLHGSHSDRPEDRCLRLVLAPTRPVSGADWPRFWTAAIRMLGLPADTRCRDGSRLYYAPSRPHDACTLTSDGTGYTFGWQDGELLDVDAILASAPEVEAVEFDDYEVPDFEGLPEPEKVLEAVRVLAAAWPAPGKNRHGAHLALAGALARAGWPAEEIANFACAVAQVHMPGTGDLRKRLGAARSSVEKVQTGHIVSGWPVLQAALDEAGADGSTAIAAVTELLGIVHGPAMDDETRAQYDGACAEVLRISSEFARAQEKARARLSETALDRVVMQLLAEQHAADPFPELRPYLHKEAQ